MNHCVWKTTMALIGRVWWMWFGGVVEDFGGWYIIGMMILCPLLEIKWRRGGWGRCCDFKELNKFDHIDHIEKTIVLIIKSKVHVPS